MQVIGDDYPNMRLFFDATDPDNPQAASVVVELKADPLDPRTIEEGFHGSRRPDLHLESFFWGWKKGGVKNQDVYNS